MLLRRAFSSVISDVIKSLYNSNGIIMRSNIVRSGNRILLDVNAVTRPLKTANTNKYRLAITDSVDPAVFHSASELIERLGGNIVQIQTDVTPAPFTSIPLFQMNANFLLSNDLMPIDFEAELSEVKEVYDCEMLVTKCHPIV